MIVGLTILVLAAISAHVRRFINEAAMFVVCLIVWTLMFVAVPLESPRRPWRLVGLAALVVVLVTFWKAGDLAIRIVRHLP